MEQNEMKMFNQEKLLIEKCVMTMEQLNIELGMSA